jgi:hypothetical protein
MRAFPRAVIALRLVSRAIPIAVGGGVVLYATRRLSGWAEMDFQLFVAIGLAFGAACLYFLRPIRRVLLLRCYEAFARSRFRIFTELGTWELLRVAYRFWPGSPLTDHVGLSTLHRIYDTVDEQRREILLEIARRLEGFPNCPVGGAAGEFLREVHASDLLI